MEPRSRALVGRARHHEHVRPRCAGRLVEHLAAGALDDAAQGGGCGEHARGDEHRDAVQEAGVAVACMNAQTEGNMRKNVGTVSASPLARVCARAEEQHNAVRACVCVRTIVELESVFRFGLRVLERVRLNGLESVLGERVAQP